MKLHREAVERTRDNTPYVSVLLINNLTDHHRRVAISSDFSNPVPKTKWTSKPSQPQRLLYTET